MGSSGYSRCPATRGGFPALARSWEGIDGVPQNSLLIFRTTVTTNGTQGQRRRAAPLRPLGRIYLHP